MKASNRWRRIVTMGGALALSIAMFGLSSWSGVPGGPSTHTVEAQITPLTAELEVTGETSRSGDLVRTGQPRPFLRIDFNQPAGLTELTFDGVDILSEASTPDGVSFIWLPGSDLAPFVQHKLSGSAAPTAGGDSATFSWRIEVVPLPRFQISLSPGWSLVSLPSRPVTSQINDVLGSHGSIDQVVTYNPTLAPQAQGASPRPLQEQPPCNPTGIEPLGPQCLLAVRGDDGLFAGTLTSLDGSKAYWVHTTTFEPLSVELSRFEGSTLALPSAYPLLTGWSMAPVNTLDIDPFFGDQVPADEYFSGLAWTRAYEYDSTSGQLVALTPGTGAVVKVGHGYHVHLSENGILLPAPLTPAGPSAGATITGSQADIPMVPGWNFVSVPGVPADNDINCVISSLAGIDTVVSYDPTVPGSWQTALRFEDGEFEGTLPTIDDGRAYWMRSTAFSSLEVALTPIVAGAPSLPPFYQLYGGWNAMGMMVLAPESLQDLDGDGQPAELPLESYLSGIDWLGAYSYDSATGRWDGVRPGSPDSAKILKAGRGYWVYAERAGVVVAGEPTSSDTPRCFTVNVTTDTDDGACDASHCSLREAINAANANAGKDTIKFNIPGPGPHTIRPTSALPAITDTVVIDGYTQPGVEPNTNASGLEQKNVLNIMIELDGSDGGQVPAGLHITASDSLIRGLAINRFDGHGILIAGAGNLVQGNFIGTDVLGTAQLGNGGEGVFITNASGNVVGGTTSQARNVISGNRLRGIAIAFQSSTGNTIQGNLIGTDANGVAPLPNGFDGVMIFDASDNLIGGTDGVTSSGPCTGPCNVISGNGFHGVLIWRENEGAVASTNVVQGNFIGLDASGTTALGNAVDGVYIDEASDNSIGGSTTDARNWIGHNGRSGVGVSVGSSNSILSNSIFDNASLGIDLGADGATPNDERDADTGSNNIQNWPELISAGIDPNGDLIVEYRVDSAPENSAYPLRIELFKADDLGEEGKTLVTSDSYTLENAQTTRVLNLNIAEKWGIAIGDRMVATATDAEGNTSEFSASVVVMPDAGTADLAV